MANLGSYKYSTISLIAICALFLIAIWSKANQFTSDWRSQNFIFSDQNGINVSSENSTAGIDFGNPEVGHPNIGFVEHQRFGETKPSDFNLIKNPNTNVYEINGKPVIWQYWHSPDMPLYVRLLVQAMQCRNPEFHVVTVHDSTIYEYLPDFKVPKLIFHSLKGSHKSDLFRVSALSEYGGIYADIDTFVLDKIYPAYDLLRNYDIVTPKWGNEIFALGAIGPVRAGTSLFAEIQRKQLKLLDEKFQAHGNRTDQSIFYPVGWTELMNDQIRGTENAIGPGKTTYLAYDGFPTVGQLEARWLHGKVWTPFKDAAHLIIPMRSTPFLFLHHEPMKEKFWNITNIQELLPTEPTIFSAFVGCALLDCVSQFENLVQSTPDAQMTAQIHLKKLLASLISMDEKICYLLNRRRDSYFLENLTSEPLKYAEGR